MKNKRSIFFNSKLFSIVVLVIVIGIVLAFSVSSFAKKTLIVGVPSLTNSLDYEKPSLTFGQITTILRDTGIHWELQPYPFDENLKNQSVWYPRYDQVRMSSFESYEISNDGKTCTFKIQPGVTSEWGNEFTADDVKFTFDRAYALNGFVKWLFGNAGITSADDVKVIDKYTFQFNVKDPSPLIAWIHCNNWTGYLDSKETKKHMTDDDPWANKWLDRHNGGFGPYKLVEWKAGQFMLFRAREDWWEGKPAIDEIMFREIPESANRVAMIENGTIDMALNLQPQEIQYLLGKPGVKLYNIKTANYTYIIMNCKMKPFDDVRVRQAMNYVIPRQEIAENVFKGFATPMNTIIPSMMPGADSTNWMYEYNLEKAKQLLADAGYPNGFEVELSYDNANPMDEGIAVAFKSSLEKIGVTLKLNKVMLSSLVEKKMKKELPITIETGLPVQPDVNYACTIYYRPFAPLNFGNYENPEVEQWMNEGTKIMDYNERIEFHKKIQKVLIEDAPVIPVVEPNLQVVLRDNIKGKFIYETVNNFYWHTLDKE